MPDSDKKDETSSKSPPMATIGQMFSFAQSSQTILYIGCAFTCAFITGACFPAMVFYFADVFEELSASTGNDNFMENMRRLALTFMALGLIIFGSMTAQTAFMETAANEMTIVLKTQWFEALLRQDMAYFDSKNVMGEATIIATSGAKYRKGVGRKLAESIQFFVTFCGSMAYAFYASWRVSLAVLAVTPFMTLSVWFLVKMNSSQTARANATYAKAGSIVMTSISAIRTVLSLNVVDKMIDQYKEATAEAYNGAVSQVAWVGLANGCQMGSFLLSYLVITLYGSFVLYDSVRDSGCDPSNTVLDNEACDPTGTDVFGALMGITFGAAVLPQVSVAIEAFMGARVACYEAIKAINRKPVESSKASPPPDENGMPAYVIDSSSSKGQKLNKVAGDIEFKNVRFSYPSRQEVEVFKDFCLQIEAGKTCALVGPSGSGKSTVVQLIERFYDPTSGTVSLDGVDLTEINVKWLRQQIGLVSQEPKLFGGSIASNIAAGMPGATQEQIENAAKMANAHDFIMTFPNGYETEVGDMGGQLSGGQKQRISIARAIVKNPKILILDEATSALDSESEKVVQEALDKLVQVGSMTTFVIAHRLSTIKNADVIAVVSDGQIVEKGKHDELLSMRGHYFGLVEAQKPKELPPPMASEHGADGSPNPPADIDNDDAKTVIQFRDVDFTYPSRPTAQVFDKFSLSVREGETLALVGPSGSGKSTTIQLIEGFYYPASGTIEFKGVDVRKLNVRYLRDQLGLVSQEPVLFDMSVEENIAYGSPGASHDQVVEAAKQANAHNFIMDFPDGYNTRVGQGSNLVSGGQKQRIAIARALLKHPSVLLLDEATSALDSESEKIVQAALDNIMFGTKQTCIVIAHRLSTIRNADRIAVIDKGRVREIGTHEQLMAKPNGKYKRLQDLQNLHTANEEEEEKEEDEKAEKAPIERAESKIVENLDDPVEMDKKAEKAIAKRAQILGNDDIFYFVVGGVGAVLAGLFFPAWGFVFAYMTEVLYTNVDYCSFTPEECDAIWSAEADDMQDKAALISYAYVGVIFSALVGFVLLFWGFGSASERMNKRVRDSAFTSLLRQEVAWFDLRPPSQITSQLQNDAALLHAFAGEPIRTLTLNLASVLVGIIVAFIYMWPFALLTLAIVPFMGFGAEMEMRMYMGEDEGDDDEVDENSPAGIAIESLSNMRTIASLTLEEHRGEQFDQALRAEHPNPLRSNAIKGSGAGLGQFFQMWGMALMFWWGGWLLYNYPNEFTYREYLIAVFGLLFSLYGLAVAAEGAVNREKAKQAAARIFELIDRKSLIDPLSTEGKMDV